MQKKIDEVNKKKKKKGLIKDFDEWLTKQKA